MDISVQDTGLLADRQTVSHTSFVFPSVAAAATAASTQRPEESVTASSSSKHPGEGLGGAESGGESGMVTTAGVEYQFCTLSSKPFHKDIIELKVRRRHVHYYTLRIRVG